MGNKSSKIVPEPTIQYKTQYQESPVCENCMSPFIFHHIPGQSYGHDACMCGKVQGFIVSWNDRYLTIF